MALAASGDLRLDAAELDPTQVSPRGEVQLSIDLRETAEYVTPFDPALCNPSGLMASTGLRAVLTIKPDWTSSISDEICVPVWSMSSGEANKTYNLVAPDLPDDVSGEEHSVTVTIQQPGLDPDSTSVSLTVEQSGYEAPQNTGPDDTGGGGGGEEGSGPVGDVAEVIVENPIKTGVGIVAVSLAFKATDLLGAD